MIQLRCPRCCSAFETSREKAGISTRCPYCKCAVQVPRPPVAATATTESPSARPALPMPMPPPGRARPNAVLLLGSLGLFAAGLFSGAVVLYIGLRLGGGLKDPNRIAGASSDGDGQPTDRPGSTTPENPSDNTPVKTSAPGAPGALKGNTRMVDDLNVTPLKLSAGSLLPCMLWSDGRAASFLALEGDKGVLRCISFPDCTVTKTKELDGRFIWMSLSAQGLLLSDPGSERILLVDPATLEVKTTIAVPKLKRAVSAPGLSWAVVCDQGPFATQKLLVMDLVKKTTVSVAIPQGPAYANGPNVNSIGVDNPVVTPDGAYVFTEGYDTDMFRFSFKDGKLTYEDGDRPNLGNENRLSMAGITISPDSKLVGFRARTFKQVGAQVTTPIFPVDTFKKTHCVLDQGTVVQSDFNMPIPQQNYIQCLRPQAVGFNLKAGCIYAPNRSHELVVFTSHGARRKEYTLEKPTQSYTVDHGRLADPRYTTESRPWQEGDFAGTVQQYLVHPGGNRLVLLTTTAVYSIELPRK